MPIITEQQAEDKLQGVIDGLGDRGFGFGLEHQLQWLQCFELIAIAKKMVLGVVALDNITTEISNVETKLTDIETQFTALVAVQQDILDKMPPQGP